MAKRLLATVFVAAAPAVLVRVWAEGQAMPLEQAIAYALEADT